jgi:hypothetical protein
MKRSVLLILVISIIAGNSLNAQGGLLKKVAKSMTNELMGKPQEEDRGPEPSCACTDAKQVVGLGGKLQLDYKELDISTRDDGAVLLKDKVSGNFYIANGDVIQGPISAGDKRLVGFETGYDTEDDGSKDMWLTRYPQYITKSNGKYIINFAGKTYGPYAQINGFSIPRSKDKFAAFVVENIVTTEEQSKKMEAEMKKAKTDQEKMDLAMKYGEEMQNKMMQGGGPSSMLPKLITSVPGATYDAVSQGQGILNSQMKYDEILIVSYSGEVVDLKGNKIITMKPEFVAAPVVFINTGNTKYAYETYGEISFSDGSAKLSDLFNPHLIKEDGKVYLAYMYYSPKKNGLMQCKIEF